MLAKILAASSLAALVSLAGASTAAAQVPDRPSEVEPTFQPFGGFSGAWQSGNLLTEGVLSGALTDSRGMPLWMMTTLMNDVGKIEGSLVPMLYSGNPVLGMGELGLIGSADLDANGSGTFHLVIHQQPDLLPVSGGGIYALGFVDGVLENGRLGSSESSAAPISSSASSAAQRAQAGQATRSGVIEDPWAPAVAELDSLASTAGQSAAGGQGLGSSSSPASQDGNQSRSARRAIIVDQGPAYGPGISVGSAAKREPGLIGFPDGVIGDPIARSASGEGSLSVGGHDRSALRRGIVVDYGPAYGPGISISPANSGGQAGAAASGAAPISSAGSSVSAAGSYGASSHQMPVQGSGKASGSWSWITF